MAGRSAVTVRRFPVLIAIAVALLLTATAVAVQVSPWPSALAIRWVFESGGAATNAAWAAEVPPGGRTLADLQYDASDADALLDLHLPSDAVEARRPLTTIVWMHGGGFIAGNRREVANYARTLAAQGYAVASVEYPIAPEARYPAPVQRVNSALAWLSRNADRYGLDAHRFVLAGDSAGAQLAAQVAALVASPTYARSMALRPGIARSQLIGTVLFCGPHDLTLMKEDSWFNRTVTWSYFGSRAPAALLGEQFSVVRNVTEAFPPTFISVGNGDPLAPQSYSLAQALRAHGVQVDSLFFPESVQPPLQHEYQFDLSRRESREAFERTRAFLSRL